MSFHKHLSVILILTIGLFACDAGTDRNETSFLSTHHELNATALHMKESSFMFDPTWLLPNDRLQRNDDGTAVLNLQKALQMIGYPVEMTSLYDDLTVWAITDLQLNYGEIIYATGIYDETTKKTLRHLLEAEEVSIEPGYHLPKPEHIDTRPATIENPYDVLALINKDFALPADYYPPDLVTPDVPLVFGADSPVRKMRSVAAEALEEMFAAAEKDGHILYARSGFRSYETQVSLFNSYAERHGEEAANQFSARPGESEHQSGLAMDVTSYEVGLDLTEEFANTPSGQWVQENASTFGFIIRYPEDKVHITKYKFEPWHLRYVGEKAAEEIMGKNITLEEYLGVDL